MTTIASMVIGARLDPLGVKAGISELLGDLQRFRNAAKKRVQLEVRFPELKGANAAQQLVGDLQRTFNQELSKAHFAIAENLIHPEEFKRSAIESAKDFNDGLIAGIADLKNRRLITPEIERALSTQLKTAGINAGKNLDLSNARQILGSLNDKFNTTIGKGKEDLAGSVINAKKFAEVGKIAGQEFDKALLVEIKNLRSQGLLTPDIQKALTDQFKTIGKASGKNFVNAANPLFGNLTTTGQRAANTLLNGLNSQYASRVSDLREKLANNLITVQQFRRKGVQAAAEFDKGISEGLSSLRSKGQATENITKGLIDSYKLAGLKAANQFAFSLDKQLGENVTSFGRTLSLFVTAPIIGAAGAAIKLGTNLESSLLRVQAVLQPTSEQMKALTQQARDLGAKTAFSASDAAKAQSFLAEQSLSVEEILQSMPIVLNLAAASMIDMSSAADIAAKILRGFGEPVSNLSKDVDILVAISTRARAPISDLGTAFSYVGPFAKAAGQSFETVAAALGALAQRGITASRGGTALRGIFSSLIKNAQGSTQGAKALAQLGISVYDTQGRFRDFIDILAQFEKAQKKFKTADFNQALGLIFKAQNVASFDTLLQLGSKAIADFRGQLDLAGGTAKRVGDVQLKGAAGAMQELKSTVEELAAAVNDSGLLKWFTSIVRGLASFIRLVSQSNPEVLKWATAFGLIVATLGPIIYSMGKLITLFAIVRSIAAAMNISLLAIGGTLGVGGLVIIGLGLLLGLFAKMKIDAAAAREEIEKFNNSLPTMGEDQLKVLQDSLITKIKFNQEILKALIHEDETRVTSNIKNGLQGPNSKLQQTTRIILDQQKQLASVNAAIEKMIALKKNAAATPVVKPTDLIDHSAEGGTGTLDLNTKKALTQMEKFLAGIQNTIRTADALNGKLSEMPGIAEKLQLAWEQVNAAIKKQGGVINDDTDNLARQREELIKIGKEAGFTFPRISLDEIQKALLLDKPKKLLIDPIIDPAGRAAAFLQINKLVKEFQDASARALASQNNLKIAEAFGDPTAVQKAAAVYEEALTTLFKTKRVLFLDVRPILPDIKTVKVQDIIDTLATEFQTAADKTLGTKLNLDLAKLTQNPKEIAAATENYRNQLAATETVEQQFALAVLHSTIPLERKKKLLQDIHDALNEAGDDKGKLSKIERNASGIASAVRGALDLAGAFGKVSDSVRETLGGISDLSSSIASFARAKISGDTFAQFTSLFGAIGAAVGVIGGVLGQDPNVKLIADALKKNSERLYSLQQELQGFSFNTVGSQTTLATKLNNGFLKEFNDLIRGPGGFKQFSKEAEFNNAFAKKFGITYKDLIAAAEKLNIQILDSKGKFIPEALNQLYEALRLNAVKLTRFGDTIDEERKKRSLSDNINNVVNNPIATIANEIDLFKKFAPSLAKVFDGLDASTKEGKAALQKRLQEFFNAVASNLIDPAAFGGLQNLDELLAILQGIADALDQVVTSFGNTLSGLQGLEALRKNIFNLDDSPIAAIQTQLDILKKLAPDIGKLFVGIDATTVAGRAQLQKALENLFAMIEGGLLNAGDLGGLSFDDLIAIITALATSMDGLKETTDAINGALSNVPSGFKVERARFLATIAEVEQTIKKAFAPPTAGTGGGNIGNIHPTIPPLSTTPPIVIAPPPAPPPPIGPTQPPVTNLYFGDVVIEGAAKDGATLYTEFRAEAVRRVRARIGKTTLLDNVLP